MMGFKEFLTEGMGVDLGCDTPEEATTLAANLGLTGTHEANGLFYPGLDAEELFTFQSNTQRKKELVSGNDP